VRRVSPSDIAWALRPGGISTEVLYKRWALDDTPQRPLVSRLVGGRLVGLGVGQGLIGYAPVPPALSGGTERLKLTTTAIETVSIVIRPMDPTEARSRRCSCVPNRLLDLIFEDNIQLRGVVIENFTISPEKALHLPIPHPDEYDVDSEDSVSM
jgi:hypothetical protein